MKFAWVCIAMVITVGPATQIKCQTDPASQVDPLIGTKTNQFKDNGNTVPGATRPFGMLYWSPIQRTETSTGTKCRCSRLWPHAHQRSWLRHARRRADDGNEG